MTFTLLRSGGHSVAGFRLPGCYLADNIGVTTAPPKFEAGFPIPPAPSLRTVLVCQPGKVHVYKERSNLGRYVPCLPVARVRSPCLGCPDARHAAGRVLS